MPLGRSKQNREGLKLNGTHQFLVYNGNNLLIKKKLKEKKKERKLY
jgi:hypothetical protein